MTQGVALSWLVLRLTGSGVDLGLMTACTFVPLLVFGPYSGDAGGPVRPAAAADL